MWVAENCNRRTHSKPSTLGDRSPIDNVSIGRNGPHDCDAGGELIVKIPSPENVGRANAKSTGLQGITITLRSWKYVVSGNVNVAAVGPFAKVTNVFGPGTLSSHVSKYTRYGPSGTVFPVASVKFQ
jgi:hypothetical protein